MTHLLERFSLWLESMGWGASLCFCLAISVALCIVIVLIDAWLSPEQCDLRLMRKAGRKPMSDELLLSPLGHAPEQFRMPRTMCDMKDRT